MNYVKEIAKIAMIGDEPTAEKLYAELHVLGLTIVPTYGYPEAEARHDPLCEAMRPDDTLPTHPPAPLVAHTVDP